MWVTVLQLFTLTILGALLAETAGYAWHRWACHAGIFRGVFKDFFRRRHFDHHMHKYSGKRLSSQAYEESCELAFHPMGVAIALILLALALAGTIGWQSFVAVLGGAILYGVYGLGGMHTLYHLDDDVVRRIWLFRKQPTWSVYTWLRDYHLVHHFANKNFAILLPIFDVVGGTYAHPRELSILAKDKRERENLFPGFDAKLSSSCGGTLL